MEWLRAPGRPSRAMIEDRATAVRTAARGDRLEAAMLTASSPALRPGELRGPRWGRITARATRTWTPLPQEAFDGARVSRRYRCPGRRRRARAAVG